jgi:hypothetical protein
MRIFKNDTWIDTSVYDNWIDQLQGCWIGIENLSSEHTETAYIFKNQDFPSNSINRIDFIPKEEDYIAVMSWGVVGDEIMIVKLEVKEEHRSRGIGQFFARLMWVWLIDNNDKIVRMPYTFRSDEAEHMIAKYAVEFEVPYAILRTVDGDYKPLEEIGDPDKVWGVATDVQADGEI